jgi:alpha-methylacyl-CoA racemase
VGRELTAIFGSRPLAHWVERFAAVDCCVTPVNTLDEALADPQFAARGMVIARPDGSRQYAPPFRLSGHAFAVTREAPAQGEHSAEVLREVGLEPDAIDALIAAGVVKAT